MRDLGCERAWQAEAVEDGRLSAADRVSFERHAGQCEVCTAEVRALAELRQIAMRLPVRTSRSLDLRRRRNELLRQANELSLHSSWSGRKWPLVFAFAAAAATLALVFWPRHGGLEPVPAVPALVAAVPGFRITPSPGSEWRTLERSSNLRLALEKGRFELEVDKLESGQRFLLELPDGELEVKGTRFVVDVDGVRTQNVRVLEGRVALRLQGREPLLLVGGQSWPEALAPAAPANVRPSDSASGAANELGRPRRKAVVSSSARTAARTDENPVAPAPSVAPSIAPTAAADFAQSMAAFSAGDYGRAEQLFDAFEAGHPNDPRLEDSTFLRAVSRSRRGDVAGARDLAREYLRRYPTGLRHLEAQRLAR